MTTRYDDELWELIPDDPGPPPEHLRRFVHSLRRVERALDLGCGDGRLTGELEAAWVTGADVSALALERARRRLTAERVELVEVTPDDPLPFPDSCFDLALCAETIEHVRDVQLFLSEVRRVLVPGGRLALTTPARGRGTALRALVYGFDRCFNPLSPHLRFFTRRSLSGLLTELGFSIEAMRVERGSLLVVAGR